MKIKLLLPRACPLTGIVGAITSADDEKLDDLAGWICAGIVLVACLAGLGIAIWLALVPLEEPVLLETRDPSVVQVQGVDFAAQNGNRVRASSATFYKDHVSLRDFTVTAAQGDWEVSGVDGFVENGNGELTSRGKTKMTFRRNQ